MNLKDIALFRSILKFSHLSLTLSEALGNLYSKVAYIDLNLVLPLMLLLSNFRTYKDTVRWAVLGEDYTNFDSVFIKNSFALILDCKKSMERRIKLVTRPVARLNRR